MKKEIFTDKYYTHFDVKKHHNDYEERVKNKSWVAKHGFYPFIHFQMGMDKYTIESEGKKEIKHKEREIYYAAHIDRYIYQYYGIFILQKKCSNLLPGASQHSFLWEISANFLIS